MKIFYGLFLFTIIFINVTVVVAQFSGGSGTSGDPYQIASAGDLGTLSGNSAYWGTGIYFEQMNNITVSGEWSPIGNSTSHFRGSYDGKGYTISGVTITDQSRNGHWAFFGSTNFATIKNVGLIGLSIAEKSVVGGLIGYSNGTTVSNSYTTGSVSGYYGYVGGFIADAYGTSISNCYSTVTVSGGTSGSGSYTGGLVGRCTNSSPISNSYHITGNVSGRDYVGGLVGGLESSSSVSQCYSSGSVSGYGAVGGLVGHKSSDIDNSYSRANVSNTSSISGGLVGQNISGTIDNCYSTGTATGTANVGGLVGYQDGGPITDSFWDTEASSQSSSAGGTGKTTAEMKTQSTFLGAGWSSSVWNIGDGINDGYAYLDWQNPGGSPLPVELIEFTAASVGSTVEIRWMTTTETNNYGFEIERKANYQLSNYQISQLQNSEWEAVGFVRGHGTTNTPKEYTFSDNVTMAGCYSYRLKQIDRDGNFTYSSAIEVSIAAAPAVFGLEQNYPNPFNPTTVLSYQLSANSMTTLIVYDALGREAAALVNELKAPGIYSVQFDGAHLPSGIYFARLSSGGETQSRKILLMK